jgi:hypothetical protein
MNKLLHSSFFGFIAICGLFIDFCPISRSQDTTLSSPNPAAAPLKPSSAPQAKSTDSKEPAAPTDRRPPTGSINGNTYTNDFFRFSLPFPKSWASLGHDSAAQMKAGITSYVLLIVGGVDRQTHGTRWIAMAAGHPAPDSGHVTAEEYVKRMADAIRAVNSTGDETMKLIGEPTEVSIGGRRMARMDMTVQTNSQGKNETNRGSSLVMIERGWVLIFTLSDTSGTESDSESAAQTINSLHFFGNKN